MSQVDALTGLMNKTAFDDELKQSLAKAIGAKEQVYLIWIDLDNFRVINESMGHSTGDELLAAIANRVRAALAPHHLIARYSGDVFAAIIEKQDQASVTLIVKQVLHRLLEPIAIHDTPLTLSASIGIAVFPEDGKDASSMCAAAEVAMHRVKQEGRNGLRFFLPHSRNIHSDPWHWPWRSPRPSTTGSFLLSTSRSKQSQTASSQGQRPCCAGNTPNWV